MRPMAHRYGCDTSHSEKAVARCGSCEAFCEPAMVRAIGRDSMRPLRSTASGDAGALSWVLRRYHATHWNCSDGLPVRRDGIPRFGSPACFSPSLPFINLLATSPGSLRFTTLNFSPSTDLLSRDPLARCRNFHPTHHSIQSYRHHV